MAIMRRQQASRARRKEGKGRELIGKSEEKRAATALTVNGPTSVPHGIEATTATPHRQPKNAAADNLLIDYKAICVMLSISVNHFYELFAAGRVPLKKIRLGRSVRYNRRHVEAWIEGGCSPAWRPER